MARRNFRVVTIACAALFLSGCVERWLLVRSDPPGAQVYLDAHPVGRTPVRIPFEHYGTREVLLRLQEERDGQELHYASAVEHVALTPPWYQYFPIDLLSGYLWPGTLVDQHEVVVPLRRVDPAALREELEQARQAGDAAVREPAPAPGPEEPPTVPTTPPQEAQPSLAPQPQQQRP